MAKYAKTRTASEAALKTSDEVIVTHEGAPAYARDPKTELFTLAITSMTAENTFYEAAGVRDSRLAGLVSELANSDPVFVQRLVPWLRNTAQLRSVPLVIAAEYALAQGPEKRAVIRSAMARADEPAEFVGYWLGRTGSKTLPGGVQRGVADAVRDLYNEYSAMKYDSGRNAVRMGDVINLVHPKPKADWQGDLFAWLLDKRHHGDVQVDLGNLPMIQQRDLLQNIPETSRREYLRSKGWVDVSAAGGITWEWLSGWLPGGMDAEAWEAVIPQMGYMALLRNLRNFDEAGISPSVAAGVAARLVSPDEVAKSRQFPYRFWSAWNANKTMSWGGALETALNLSTQNIPEFDGSTLVLIDVSASMTWGKPSGRTTVRNCDIAALFGAAVFNKNPNKTRVAVFGDTSKEITPSGPGAVLRLMDVFTHNHGVGHGTMIRASARTQYKGEDRVVVFTDLQAHDGGVRPEVKDAYVHYFDLAGYEASPDEVGDNRTFMYGGFVDATFRQMPLHERVGRSSWDDILS